MKKHYAYVTALALLMLVLAAVLGACGKGKEPESEPEAVESAPVISNNDPYRNVQGKVVGISFPDAADAGQSAKGTAISDFLRRKGCTVNCVYGDGTLEKQTADVDALISAGCSLLIISPVSDTGFSKVMDRAKAGGISVIACDRIISGSDALGYYVATDSYATGVQQGRYIIEALGLKEDVNSKEYHLEFAAGDPDDYRARYAFNGAYDTLKPYIDAGIVIVGSGQSSFTRAATKGGDSMAAQQRMKTIINGSYSDGKILDMVVCADDAIAQAVIKAIGDDYRGKNHVIVTGQGGSLEGFNAIRGKKQSMTTFLPPGEESQVIGALGFAILCGDVTDSNVIREGNWNFTCSYDTSSYDNGSGIVPSFLITPVAITEGNLKAELIDKGYYVLEGDVLTEAGKTAKQ